MPEAVWFAAPRQVELREEPMQLLGPHDVRVRALASGVSAGSEMLVYRGEAPKDLEADLPTIAGDFGLPIKFGYASVGTVLEVGAGVEKLAADDLVFALYPHQTEYVVPETLAFKLSAGTDPQIGIFTANLETAVTVALDAHPRLSESVLVMGQGVLGLLVTLLLRRAGAGPIVTVDAHERRRAASIAAGADHALSPHADLAAEVRELTDGRGVDVVVEVSGNPAALQGAVDAVAFAGSVVVASWYGSKPVTLDLGSAFHRRRIRLTSSQVSTLDPALAPRWDRDRRSALVNQLLGELPLAELITHSVPFRDAASAYRLLDQTPEECIQVTLDYV